MKKQAQVIVAMISIAVILLISGCATSGSNLNYLPPDTNIQKNTPEVGAAGKYLGIWTGQYYEGNGTRGAFVTLAVERVTDGFVSAIYSWEGQFKGWQRVYGKITPDGKIVLSWKWQDEAVLTASYKEQDDSLSAEFRNGSNIYKTTFRRYLPSRK